MYCIVDAILCKSMQPIHANTVYLMKYSYKIYKGLFNAFNKKIMNPPKLLWPKWQHRYQLYQTNKLGAVYCDNIIVFSSHHVNNVRHLHPAPGHLDEQSR